MPCASSCSARAGPVRGAGDDNHGLTGPVSLGEEVGDAFDARLVAVEELDDMFRGDRASNDVFPDTHTGSVYLAKTLPP